MDDWELLREYAERGSEAAFRALVDRHLGLIYAAARRQVPDSQLAEEVTQAVLILLAKKAGTFGRNLVLPSWLFRTTRFVASRAGRAERRRQQREREACEMQSIQSLETASPALAPLLDEALARLGEQDRSAVLLRFVHEQSLREVGARLGVSEEAAKKRASRALRRLRSFFARRGFTVSATLLAGVLSAHLAQAVPADMAGRLAAGAMAAKLARGAALPPLAREALNAWRWAKIRLMGALAASVAGLLSLGTLLALQGHPGLKRVTPNGGLGMPTPESAQAPKADRRPSLERSQRLPERILSFHVIGKDTREPIGGAPLAVNTVSERGWKPRFDLVTDEHGTAAVPYLANTARLDVGVVASGWAARFATWFADKEPSLPAEYTLAVERVTNWMGGWLRDEHGQPVTNAVIEMEFGTSDMAQEENPRERPGFLGPAPVARSDARGWWTCALVDSTARRIPGLRARHPDFAPTQIDPGSYARFPEQTRDRMTNLLWSGRVVTTMTRGIQLRGRVINEDGRPIPGAQIDHDPSSSEPLHTESDSNGWFVLAGLASGPFDFITTAPGFAQDYQKVTLQEGMPPVEVHLRAGGRLRLQVVDEEGMAISGAWVALTGPGGMYMPGLNWSGMSDEAGRIEWTSASTDQMLSLCASKAPEFGMSRGIFVKADGQEHTIRLGRTFAVTGQVTDAATGEPVRELKAFPGYGQGQNCWYRGDTRHSTDGTFKVCFTEGQFPWRVRVEADGYAPFISGELGPDSSRRLDVVLRRVDPARTVRGVVLRTDGMPAAGAQVALLSPEHSVDLGGTRFSDRAHDDKLIVDTDAAGQFAFPQEQQAHMVVAVSGSGFARVPVSDISKPLEVHLQPWGRIEGTIDPRARRRPVKYVMVDDLQAMDSPGYMRLDSQYYNARPGDSDRFAFEHVPPGRLCVWLDAGVIEDNQTGYHDPTWVQVTAGETARVVVTAIGYRVRGRFVKQAQDGWAGSIRYAALDNDSISEPAARSGNSFTGSRQWVRSFFDPGRLIVGADGRFESRDPLPPGLYHLLLTMGKTRYEQEIIVPEPAGGSFESNPLNPGPGELPVLDLGEVIIAQKQGD